MNYFSIIVSSAQLSSLPVVCVLETLMELDQMGLLKIKRGATSEDNQT